MDTRAWFLSRRRRSLIKTEAESGVKHSTKYVLLHNSTTIFVRVLFEPTQEERGCEFGEISIFLHQHIPKISVHVLPSFRVRVWTALD